MKMKLSIAGAMGLAAAGMFGVLSAPALAQGTAEERSACMGDAFKFCGSDIPDVSRIEACLKSKVNQLSPGCKAEFEPNGHTKMRRSHFN